MRKENLISFVLATPTVASIVMSVSLVLNRRLLYDDSVVPVFVPLWIVGTLSSVLGLIYARFLVRRYSFADTDLFGIISILGIVANAVTFFRVLGGVCVL